MESTMAEQNADLLKQAEELGIKVDGRWKDDRIQSEIDAKLSEAPHERSDPLDHDGDGKKGGTAPAMIPMAINRDIWVDNPNDPDDPIRHRRGKVMEFTIDDAMAGLESGALSRVK